MTVERRNTTIEVNRIAKTALQIFHDILEKDKLDKDDLLLIVDKIMVYDGIDARIDIQLKPDITMLLETGTLTEEELEEVGYREKVVNFNWDIEGNLSATIVQKVRNQKDKAFGVNVICGGDTSVAPTEDDVEQATEVFREELEVLKSMFIGYNLKPFLNPDGDPVERYRLLSKAAEYVFVSTEELNSEGKNGTQKVSFKTYFLKTVKRMRLGYDIAQPSGELSDIESALAQCFMAIAGLVRKMSGTTELDTDSMNRAVSKMVDEALRYNQVESVLDAGEEEDIFSPEYFEKLSDVKMPATKLELLIKMIRKQIKEYSKINKIAAKTYQEMLEETIAIYHERRKHISVEEAGATQEQASEDIIKNATEQALQILRQMNESRESFRKIGLTFEEKAFYDILVSLRDQYNFEYGKDKEIGGMIVNDKCKILAKKVKEIIDTKSSFSDWLNNQNVRNQLKLDIKICLVKNGYPPQYSPEVFTKVMEQVENFEENSDMPLATTYTFPQSRTVSMVAEDIIPYGNKSEN